MAVLAAAACQTWFDAGRFVATGDVPPLLGADLGGITPLWSHQLGGAGAPSFQISGALPALVVAFTRAVGGSDIVAQRLFYTVLFAGVAVGVAYFSAQFSRRRIAVGLAGLVGAFNPYVMTNVPNPVMLVVLAASAVLGGMVVRAARDGLGSPVMFGAVTLAWSYVVANPPFLAVSIAWVVVVALMSTVLVGAGGAGRALRFLLRALPWVLVLNLWWAVPAFLTLTGATGGTLAAVTDVREWGWTHARSSVLNALRLNAGWGWAYPEYFPYAPRLEQAPLVALSLVLPITCLAAPLMARNSARKASVVLGAGAIVVVVLSTGLHPPFGSVNLWLFNNLPFYWLLREPASKLGIVLVVLYAALAAIAADGFLSRRAAAGRGLGRSLVAVAAASVAVSSYPLWNGSVVPRDRAQFGSARVAVPYEWRAATEAVNASTRLGKALVLPLADYYQMPTTWGYYGTDVIAESLLERPTITRLAGGYLAASNGFLELMAATEKALLLGDSGSVPRLLQALGVSHVLLRHDLAIRSPRHIADPEALRRGLDGVSGIARTRASPIVDVYEVAGGPDVMVRPYANLIESAGGRPGLVVADAPSDAAVVRLGSADGAADAWSFEPAAPRARFRLAHGGRYRVSVIPTSPTAYSLRSLSSERGSDLSLVRSGAVSVDRADVAPSSEERVPIPTGSIGVRVADQVLELSTAEQRVTARETDRLVFLEPAPERVVPKPLSAVGDCHDRARSRPYERIFARPLDDQAEGIEVGARASTACVTLGVAGYEHGDAFRVRFHYRMASGLPPRVCLWQEGPNRCASLPDLDTSSSWRSFTAMVQPDPATVGLSLFLYADGTDDVTTLAQYRSVAVDRLVAVGPAVSLPEASRRVEMELGRGEHQVAMALGPHTPSLGPFSSVGNCGSRVGRGRRPAILAAAALQGAARPSFRLRARVRTACISSPLVGFRGAGAFRLSFQYRTAHGSRAPRVCVWQEGLNRCSALPGLARSGSWRRFDATVVPEEGATGLRLYLYADGQANETSVTEYRSVEFRGIPSSAVVVSPVSARERGSVAIKVLEHGPERYRLRVSGANGPLVLALADTFDTGWRLGGLPPGVRAEHVVVDGYANGWILDGRPPGEITLEYRPGRWAAWARRVSLVAGVLALIAATASRSRPLRSVRAPVARNSDSAVLVPLRVGPVLIPGLAVLALGGLLLAFGHRPIADAVVVTGFLVTGGAYLLGLFEDRGVVDSPGDSARRDIAIRRLRNRMRRRSAVRSLRRMQRRY